MIIVTGGAGFIGSNILQALNQRGRDDILVVDDLSDGTLSMWRRWLGSISGFWIIPRSPASSTLAPGATRASPKLISTHCAPPATRPPF